jgi:hypothetical protein
MNDSIYHACYRDGELSQMRDTPQVLDLQCSFLKKIKKTGKANSQPWRLEEGAQMRRSAGRIIAEIGSPAAIRPIRGGQFSKSIFEKARVGHTAACAAAWAVAMPATICVRWAVLARMDVIARIFRRRHAMIVKKR